MIVISVIICTYNRAPLLKRALKSLTCQTLRPDQFEVIVVNDGSSDHTAEVCKSISEEMPNLIYRSTDKNTGLGNAANFGVQSAKGDYLLFTDDDCIASKDWVERMGEALKKYALVAGSVSSPNSSFVEYCHNIAEFHPFMGGRSEGPIDFIAGSNMGFRRSLFDEMNGFSAGTMSPDMEFILRAREKGYQIYFIPKAVVTHEHNRTSFSSIFRYSADHASETILLRNKYRLLLHTPFIFRSPILILLAAPVISLKVTAGIYLSNSKNVKFIWTAPVIYALKLAWCWGAARGLRNSRKAGIPYGQ